MAVPKILYTPVWDRILYMNAYECHKEQVTDNHPEPCKSLLRLGPLQNKISPIKTVKLIWDSRHLRMICFGLPFQKAVMKIRKKRRPRYQNFEFVEADVEDSELLGVSWLHRSRAGSTKWCDLYPIWLQPQEDVKSDRTYMCWLVPYHTKMW